MTGRTACVILAGCSHSCGAGLLALDAVSVNRSCGCVLRRRRCSQVGPCEGSRTADSSRSPLGCSRWPQQRAAARHGFRAPQNNVLAALLPLLILVAKIHLAVSSHATHAPLHIQCQAACCAAGAKTCTCFRRSALQHDARVRPRVRGVRRSHRGPAREGATGSRSLRRRRCRAGGCGSVRAPWRRSTVAQLSRQASFGRLLQKTRTARR